MAQSTYIQDFIQLLYPQLCVTCGNHLYKNESILCNKCIYELPYTHEPIATNFMANQLRAMQPIDGVFSLLYQNPRSDVEALIHQLKYKARKDVGAFLGRQLGEQLAIALEDYDCVVPVPLHPKKKARRGFNQSEVIAKALAEELNKELICNELIRIKNTETQTRKSRLERFKNMENVFSCAENHQLKAYKIILVDDVLTTGATQINCAKTLFEFGAQKVVLVTAAKADLF